MRSLPHFPAGIIGRFRTSTNVRYKAQTLQAKELAEAFRPGRARYDRQLNCYAKRLCVYLLEVGQLELIFIWYPNKFDWNLNILVSPIQAGLQELIKAFKASWSLEVMHRTLRQNLALATCQALSFIAQLRHFDFCISALQLMRRKRRRDPTLSWKQAQKLAAQQANTALLTELNQVAA